MGFDPKVYYQLSNAFLGTGESLEVAPGGGGKLKMGPTAGGSGQLWKLVELAKDRYALRTELLGDGYSVDATILDAERRRPWLAPTGVSPGQAWILRPIPGDRYRLTNDLTGPDAALDTAGGTDAPILRDGDSTGQQWTLTPGKAVAGTTSIPELQAAAGGAFAGPPDFEMYAQPLGVVRAVMIFVDFHDAPGSGKPEDVARHLLGNGAAQRFFRDVSNGQLALDVTVVSHLGWKRMRRRSDKYDTSKLGPHRAYVAEAAKLYAAQVEFADYPLVLIATPEGANLQGESAAFHVGAGDGAPATSGEVRLAVTFDGSSNQGRYTSLIHEVSHLFGLADLYPSGAGADDSKAGCWSILSDVFHSWGVLGWERHRNGWLAPERKTYLAADVSKWAATLHPLSAAAGLSMIVLPVDDVASPSKVFVVELAQEVQGDGGEYWGEGVLLYTVDAKLPSGGSPVEVLGRAIHSPNFGNLFEAPYVVGGGTTHAEPPAELTLRVVERIGASYRIEIDYRRR